MYVHEAAIILYQIGDASTGTGIVEVVGVAGVGVGVGVGVTVLEPPVPDSTIV